MSLRVHILSLLSVLVAAFDLSLGVWVLRSNLRARANQLFFLICLGFSIWSFGYTFLPGAPADRVWIWFRLSAPGWTLTPSLLLHFLIVLTGSRWLEGRRWLLAGIYAPGLLYLLQALRGPGHMGVTRFVDTPWGWSDVYGPLTLAYAGYLIYFSGFVFIGLALAWRWGRRSELVAEQKQARLVVLTGAPIILLVALSGIFLPWMGVRSPPEAAHLIAAVWLLAIAYAVSRYRMMSLSASTLASEILREMADGVVVLDREGRVESVNGAACRILGFDERGLRGRRMAELLAREDGDREVAFEELLARGEVRALEVGYTGPGGDRMVLELSSWPVIDRLEQSIGLVLLVRDLSERRSSQERVRFASTHDPLTGLPNRALLDDRLRRALERAQREKKPFAVVMFDIDDFQQVNDLLGYRVGDLVLERVARSLSHSVRGIDTVCRIGGDEFLILVEDLLDSDDSDIVAKRIFDELAKPTTVAGHTVSLTGSMGISTYPFDGLDVETLMKKANLALHSSKEKGRGIFQFFSPRMNVTYHERMELENGLRRAIAHQEFFLVYQPLVDFRSGRIAGLEALLRWNSPQQGVLSPASFMRVAERFGKIVEIGEWVLRTACQQCREWQRAGFPAVPIAVNVSARQLQESDFAHLVRDALTVSGLEPSLLELELTESAAMQEIDRSRELLAELADLGIRIVIDDFGTGYSSFGRLRLLPMMAVKVDRSLLGNIVDDHKDRALLLAVMAMARSLEVDVVAEGIETPEQLAVLRSFERNRDPAFRCDKVQGYLFSKPVGEERVSDLFRQAQEWEGGFGSLRAVWSDTEGGAVEGPLPS